MSLQAILDAIEASGEAQIQEIEANTQARLQAILSKARAEAEELRGRAHQAATERAERDASHVIQRANLEALNIIGEAREALVEEALRRTREQLADARIHDNYPQVLRRLIQDATAALRPSLNPNEEPRLQADPHDRELVELALRELNVDLSVTYDLDCWGGVVVTSTDGRVVVTNTLESRFEEAASYLRQQLSTVFEAVLSDPNRKRPCRSTTTVMRESVQ